jgi:hypothetical protein
VANDKERLWLLKHWIVNHLCYKETGEEIDRQIVYTQMDRKLLVEPSIYKVRLIQVVLKLLQVFGSVQPIQP